MVLRNDCPRVSNDVKGNKVTVAKIPSPKVREEGLIKSSAAVMQAGPTSDGVSVSGANPPLRQLRVAGQRRKWRGAGGCRTPRHPCPATVQTWIR